MCDETLDESFNPASIVRDVCSSSVRRVLILSSERVSPDRTLHSCTVANNLDTSTYSRPALIDQSCPKDHWQIKHNKCESLTGWCSSTVMSASSSNIGHVATLEKWLKGQSTSRLRNIQAAD